VYRAQFGLPACTTGNGCFRKVNQDGGTAPPAVDAGWAQEVSLDLDMVSAVCPSCRILLVEANSASYADLGAAVDRAAAMGATQISNSYGGSEQFGSSYDSHYDHPGIDITASSGDSGYGVSFPASSPHVTAVGGTHLVKDGSARGWTETVWSGAGSGCSSVFSKPSYQHDPGCAKRSVADVSAVSDPATGVAVYDSYPYQGASGWFVFGGTSVAAPVIAAVNALAGGRSPGTMYGGFAYANPSLFFDVVSGSNGSCGGSYLCTGAPGYDGPTGVGSPNGVAPAPAVATPANTSPPAISGTPTEGQTLTSNQGSWSGSPSSYTYQWHSCNPGCVNVGANSPNYGLAHSDVGATITVTVTAANSAGSADSTSGPVGPVAAVAPDFTIAVSPSSRTIRRGTATTYTVTVTPNSSFSGPVALSATGGPAGTGRTFNPSSTSATSTLTVTTSATAPTSTYTLNITGTSGALSHSTSATLVLRRK
jgi:subtilase family serine protease